MTSDHELLERLKEGEREAFDELFKRHQKSIYFLALRYLGNQEDAMEITQQAFVRAFNAVHRFEGRSSFKTWLYRITVNLCKNHLSRRPNAQEIPLEEIENRLATDPDPGPDPDERRQRVKEALEGLPERQRQVVLLRVYEELPFKEIARVLGCSAGSAKVSYHHAVKGLKEILNNGEEGA
ncbi:RNA polymerase sigma factor [Thermodesulfobacteriota bacterium]